ncbi:MAG: hypothetical protein LBE80_10380, partial [Deltaproteobacteria bacterium]|nr:hypothetical protein [Deltaproteobacteria bacterium]
FRVIFIAALNHNLLPHAAAISQGDEVLKKDGLIAEKCLLYVAMTRAQKTLYLTSYGQASEFLTALI